MPEPTRQVRIPAQELPKLQMQTCLNLADCFIRIRESADYPTIFWPDPPWDLFECPPAQVFDIDIEAAVVNRLPDLPHGDLLFDSNHGLWKLYEAGDHFYFESLHTKHLHPFIRALISKDYTKAQAFILPTRYRGKRGWSPAQIINPIGEFCLLTWLARRGAFMLHASGIVLESGAWVFSGPSGAGKTTLAELFSQSALKRLSDETILIRQSEDGNNFIAYGTPWLGEGHVASNEKAPLRSLCFIRHAPERHEIRPLPITELTRLFFQQSCLPYWDALAMEKTATAFKEIALQGLCYDLSFLKQPDVVDFLKQFDAAPV